MEPHHKAFPVAVDESSEFIQTGITYRQYAVFHVAAGLLANPSIDWRMLRADPDMKEEVVQQILTLADILIEEEEVSSET